MKHTKSNKKTTAIVALSILLLAASTSLVWPGLLGIPLIISSTLVATLCIGLLTVIAVKSLRAYNPQKDNYDRGPLAKTLSTLLITALITGVISVTKSLWIEPSHAKFVYENIATVATFAAILVTFIVSALQKDIYWVTRKKTLKLDERQIKERQQVFETSYKLGAFLILGVAWITIKTIHNIPAIMTLHQNSVPGHLYYLPISVALTLFGLPLIVASWKK